METNILAIPVLLVTNQVADIEYSTNGITWDHLFRVTSTNAPIVIIVPAPKTLLIRTVAPGAPFPQTNTYQPVPRTFEAPPTPK